jgi:uncharacterized tellurite resistance protein B-like protein
VIDWTKTDEQILGELLEDVSKPTGRLVTFGDIDAQLGAEAYQVIVGVFEAAQSVNPSLRPAFLALSTTGLTLDSPSRFAMIDQLATAGYGADGLQPWPVEWVKQIKAMAVTVRPRWQVVGLSQEPTIESVQGDRNRHRLEAEAIRRLAEISITRNRFDAASALVRQKIESGQVSKSDVIEAFSLEWSNTCPH